MYAFSICSMCYCMERGFKINLALCKRIVFYFKPVENFVFLACRDVRYQRILTRIQYNNQLMGINVRPLKKSDCNTNLTDYNEIALISWV